MVMPQIRMSDEYESMMMSICDTPPRQGGEQHLTSARPHLCRLHARRVRE